MRIIHFSDPHAGGPAEDWMAYLDKRWVGVFNYTFRRRFRIDLNLLKKAVDFILADSPDVAVCTGDLTSAGQPGEFARVLEILTPLRNSGIPLLYLPGNHDCYVTRPKCIEAVNYAVEYLSCGRYKFSDLPQKISINGVDFFLINCSRPSNLLCSWGFLHREDSNWLKEQCETPHESPRILLTHYPILEKHPWLRVRHRLFGEKPVRALLNAGLLDLVLCGHVHMPRLEVDEYGHGQSIAGSVTMNALISEIKVDEKLRSFQFRRINLK